ncbi:MAG: hypothetical protein JXM70_21250, partial [Pirellulales bacterium]|nr:hypothetical protein [Pirellulales bacterium]
QLSYNRDGKMKNEDKKTPSDKDTSEEKQSPSSAERLSDGIKEVRQCCDDLQHKATATLKNARETTFGDFLDKTVVFVKRHPRTSMGIAVTLGFFLGRLFRR